MGGCSNKCFTYPLRFRTFTKKKERTDEGNQAIQGKAVIMEKDIPRMATIKQASQITGIAEHALRLWCINKQIVYVRCGSKYLVNIDRLVEFLNGNED